MDKFVNAEPGSLWILDLSQSAQDYANFIPETEDGNPFSDWARLSEGSVIMKLYKTDLGEPADVERVLVMPKGGNPKTGWIFTFMTDYLVSVKENVDAAPK